MDGVLIVSPLKMPSISWPPATRRNTLGSGRGGTKLSSRSTARGDSTSMPCAASPPMAFCQEKVTTSKRSHGSRCAKAAEVASQIVSPARSSGIAAFSGTRQPEVVPFQVKTTSRSKSTSPKSTTRP